MATDVPRSAAAEADEDSDVLSVDWKKLLINVFVLWQLLVVLAWIMPASQLQRSLVSPGFLRDYGLVTGCDQYWNMFAPTPANIDTYMTANVVYQNGATKSWSFPRMHTMGYLRRYQEERFRKMIESAHLDSNQVMWPYLAHFVALANNKEPRTNPVVHVDLIRHWQSILPPGTDMPPYVAHTFYSHDFAPGSLSH